LTRHRFRTLARGYFAALEQGLAVAHRCGVSLRD
jgi:hypothetical protein